MTPEQVSSDPVQPTRDLEPAALEAAVKTFQERTGGFDPTDDRLEIEAIIRAYLAARSAPEAGKAMEWERQVADLIRSIAEWDDRTSPEDYPDHLLLTPQELTEFARCVSALASVPAPSGEPVAWQYRYADYNTGKPVEWRNGKGEAFAPLPGYERRSIPQAVPAEDIADLSEERDESMWRFWSKKAHDVALKLTASEAEASDLRRKLEKARKALEWQTMDSAPKDGSWFAAMRRWPSGTVDVHVYQWEGAPNFWIERDRNVCIRPDYQDRYLWAPLPAASPSALTDGGGDG
ncbi:MAG: hypothetical protein E5X05_01420 [Mesorhizobium sp.]|nr:MAG: hypothetical protein E5X05_01420 [Mesorhizobium sp.]